MIKAAVAESDKQSRELVSIAALTATAAEAPLHPAASTPSSSAVTVVGKLKTRQKEVGFQVMVGAAHQLEPSLGLGAVGAILAFACPAPMACYEIYAALKDGDSALAREKQERVKPAAQRVVGDLGRPRREVRDGSQRLLWRSGAAAVSATLRRAESRDREVDGGNQELSFPEYSVELLLLCSGASPFYT